jgi:hypothetical protein
LDQIQIRQIVKFRNYVLVYGVNSRLRDGSAAPPKKLKKASILGGEEKRSWQNSERHLESVVGRRYKSKQSVDTDIGGENE